MGRRLVEIVMLAKHRGGDDVISVQLELIVESEDAGIKQALRRAVGINAVVNWTVENFVLGHRLRRTGICAGRADADEFRARNEFAPRLERVVMDEIVDEKLFRRVLAGKFPGRLKTGEVQNQIRVLVVFEN